MATQKLTPEQRRDRFNALFDNLPCNTNIERIRTVAKLLHCRENTVRIYRLARPSRIIPASKLAILQDALRSAGLTAEQ